MVSGMSLDYTDIPSQESLPYKIKMNAVETAAAESHTEELLQKGAIKPSTFNPQTDFLSNIFLTPKLDRSFRCILNLKNFNQFLEFAHFKMENLQLILDSVTPLYWMCVLDLSDAYLTVAINWRYFRFLKFSFQGRIYVYVCLPFGISSVPRTFSKFLKPITARLRLLGIILVIYIDDLWISAVTYQGCLQSMYTSAETLNRVGFLLNRKKSKPQPSQQVVALGYFIDSITMTVSLPAEKESNILQHISELLSTVSPSIRYVARVLGKMISCFPVLPLGRAHYRFIETK